MNTLYVENTIAPPGPAMQQMLDEYRAQRRAKGRFEPRRLDYGSGQFNYEIALVCEGDEDPSTATAVVTIDAECPHGERIAEAVAQILNQVKDVPE